MKLGGKVGIKGDLKTKLIHPSKNPFWRLRNLPNLWRGLWRVGAADVMGLAQAYGDLSVMVFRKDGTVENLGLVSRRVVTTAWVTAMATLMFDGSGPAATAYDHHDAGTGTNNEATSDTALQTPWGGSRATGTPSNPSAGVYRTVGTISFTGTFAITEHGVFSASTSGTLLDRSKFAAINVENGDSIQFTYSLTFTAGG